MSKNNKAVEAVEVVEAAVGAIPVCADVPAADVPPPAEPETTAPDDATPSIAERCRVAIKELLIPAVIGLVLAAVFVAVLAMEHRNHRLAMKAIATAVDDELVNVVKFVNTSASKAEARATAAAKAAAEQASSRPTLGRRLYTAVANGATAVKNADGAIVPASWQAEKKQEVVAQK